MNISIGLGQEINIYDIKSIAVTKTERAFKQYYKTLTITTQDNQEVELTLYSKDKEILL
tara:strand:+ start:467 stop:643 length:177 start_codon:yes stop_codon:yes gene_type:complete